MVCDGFFNLKHQKNFNSEKKYNIRDSCYGWRNCYFYQCYLGSYLVLVLWLSIKVFGKISLIKN